jgi:hypothetical protein
VIAEVNGDHHYGIVESEPRQYGTCDFEFQNKAENPRKESEEMSPEFNFICWKPMAKNWVLLLTLTEYECYSNRLELPRHQTGK